MTTIWLDETELMTAGARRLIPTASVLEVGTANRPMAHFKTQRHLCVEPHAEYVADLRGQGYEVIADTWDNVLPDMESGSFDSVIALDFIEHLKKRGGRSFLQQARRIARRQVVIFTPLGWYPQNFDDPTLKTQDGFHGLHWQTHQSAWFASDFGSKWTVLAAKKFHYTDQNGILFKKPIGALWAFWNVEG